MSYNNYFKPLFNEISSRSVEATLGTLGIKLESLRNHLRHQLACELQAGNRMLGDPVFEAVFPWTTGDVTFQQLADQGTLWPALVKALDSEHKNVTFGDKKLDLSGQALKAYYKPYTHQLHAWATLAQPDKKSIVVTSGTGSGKTECFMVPILNDLIGQLAHPSAPEQLVGVQALFIYPLNALINSQRERLFAWTLPSKHKLRFCLYNGNTPPSMKLADLNSRPTSEVHDRKSLWDSPPPILVTNPTMLEYMLIRNQDRPILEKSQGQLKYIVLDEAHTYIGSQAAELALLIRRVLNGFGVISEQVRFIATSATIGSDDEAKDRLKQYLSDLGGIPKEQIEVIDGHRNVPVLPPNPTPNTLGIDELNALTQADRKAAVYTSDTARNVRNFLINRRDGREQPKQLTDLANQLFPHITDAEARQQEALGWLDLASQGDLKQNDVHFLPLRGHFFHKVLHGLWACVDKHCPEKRRQGAYLNDPAWGFGYVYTQQRLTCNCGAPVYELVFCNECNTGHLRARIEEGKRFVQAGQNEADEYMVDIDVADGDDVSAKTEQKSTAVVISQQLDIDRTYSTSTIDNSGTMVDNTGADAKTVYWSQQGEFCAACGFDGQGPQGVFRPAYLGMPFYTSSIVPTLLEHTPDGKDPLGKPMRGRNLITFTDSRQGTARIAVKMQQNAERLKIRGLVYQEIRKNSKATEIEEKCKLIADLQPLSQVDSVKEHIKKLQNEIAELQQNSIGWADMVTELSLNDDIRHIYAYYHNMDPEVFDSEKTLARMLLVREFGRRPKRGNSLETLGLTAVGYEGLTGIQKAPPEWEYQQFTIAQWRDFLKICLDFYVREDTTVRIPREWLNWIGAKIYPKNLLSPNNQDGDGRTNKQWTSYRTNGGKLRQHRTIRLLAHLFGFDLLTITRPQIAVIDSLMEQAWNTLRP